MLRGHTELGRWVGAAFERVSESRNARRWSVELLQHLPFPICVVRGPACTVELANAAMCALTLDGRPLGKPLLGLVPRECAERLRREIVAILRDGATAREVAGEPLAVSSRDTKMYDWSLQPLPGARRDEQLIAIVGHDVTWHVQALHRLEQERARAEDAARAKDDFLGQLAHELRNPLSSIAAAIGVLGQPNSAAAQRAFRTLDRQIKHLSRLIGDLVDLTRIQHGALALHRERVELARIIDQAIEVAAPLVRAHGQGIQIDLPEDLRVDAGAAPASGWAYTSCAASCGSTAAASRYRATGQVAEVCSPFVCRHLTQVPCCRPEPPRRVPPEHSGAGPKLAREWVNPEPQRYSNETHSSILRIYGRGSHHRLRV
jgi:signal transduction histidine kinase